MQATGLEHLTSGLCRHFYRQAGSARCPMVRTSADNGVGRVVVVLFASEGADVAVAHHSSTEDARETARHIGAVAPDPARTPMKLAAGDGKVGVVR